jgi:hypothetical protein
MLSKFFGALEVADSWFGRALGGYLIARSVIQEVWPGTPWMQAISTGVDLTAASLASAIFIVWLGSALVGTHKMLALEEQALSAWRKLRRRLQHWRSVQAVERHIVVFKDVPKSVQGSVVNDLAMLAFTRWTSNASLPARRQFFGRLTERCPDEVSVWFEVEGNARSYRVSGYLAWVALTLDNYRRHLFGQVNLFEQDEQFFLSSSDVQERVQEARKDGPFDREKYGMAVYILGMNVRGGLEGRYGEDLLLALKQRLRAFLAGFPPGNGPNLYCATTIPSVEKTIARAGFLFRGNHDRQGNRLYERDPE